jgi:multiple sugar transport system ATP-binding protein
MASVTFKQLNKVYDGKVQALKDIDLKVNAQDFLVIVGPSGCGKTTLLMILAGLERETSGEVWIDDTCVNNVDPKDRDVAVVFQSYALYPHMTVFGNMAFSLKVRRKKKDFINRKVAEVAEMLNLTEYLKRKPHQLSGGQK